MFQSTSLRLAAAYTGLFAVAVVALGIAIFLGTRSSLSQLVDDHIRFEAAALSTEYRTEGLEPLAQAIRDRDNTPGALDYGLEGPGRKPIAGRLAGIGAATGWSTVQLPQTAESSEVVRVLAAELGDGHRLLVGDDLKRMQAVDGAILKSFGLAVLGVLVIGMGAGFLMSRQVHKRLVAISSTAEAIIDGDISRRVPVAGSNNDLDRLASTINRMLDRISALFESFRQVSNNVAHDLRTPLTRLRQRLEGELVGGEGPPRREAIEGALEELDAILDTFSAVLRISQIEAGGKRIGFRRVDLDQLARTVVEDFAPSAEEGGRSLTLASAGAASVEGDRGLLIQMLVNLVENALMHTPPGSKVRVATGVQGGSAWIAVADDGPGVPGDEYDRLFERFYRLERSRSTPGNGLGLSLVAAIVKLHGGEVALADAKPGLEVRIVFDAAQGKAAA